MRKEVRYSSTEEEILKLIPRDGQTTTIKQLMETYYRNRKKPYYAQIYMSSVLRSLILKVTYNREQFKLRRTDNEKPIHFWIEQ
jgi:hypothetical protein